MSLLRAAGSVFVGLFVGMQPWFGLHLPLCLALSLLLRLDAIVCYAAANISNPLFAPLLVAAEIEVGRALAERLAWILPTVPFLPDRLARFPSEMMLGALVLGLLVASTGAVLTGGAVLLHEAWSGWRKQPRQLRAAIARVRRYYAHTERSQAWYVAFKLWTDPVYRVLSKSLERRHHVTDLGCGRGQMGLLLLELELVDQLLGLDWDAEKIATARQAAAARAVGTAQVAEFSVVDLTQVRLLPTDQVLLLDVLHYLTLPAQDQLLREVARVLRPGGKLVIRDVDGERGRRGRFARFCERVGTKVGFNRGEAPGFRSMHGLSEELGRLGFVELESHVTRSYGLDNQLLIATRSGDAVIGDAGQTGTP